MMMIKSIIVRLKSSQNSERVLLVTVEKYDNYKKANKNQLNEVRNFYHSLIDDMEKRGLIVTWIK